MRCYTLDNETTTNQDITKQLQQLLTEVQHNGNREQSKEAPIKRERVHKIDVLNLPPRKEVHSKIKLRTRIRFGKATVRLLVVIIILIALTISAYVYWGNDLKGLVDQF